MAIKTGRYGQVKYSPDGIAPAVEIISINAWTASFKTEYEDVSCFGDENRVYIPGLRDSKGSLSGFWNSAEITLFEAAIATVPGTLELVPNSSEPTFFWSGLAYMDAEVDCSLAAPKVSGEWVAAGPWAGPEQTPLARARREAGRDETNPQLKARADKERAAQDRDRAATHPAA
jgi:hypothetical protein